MTTLVALVIDLAIQIGKAIVRRLAKWTLKRLVTWMRKRVGIFKDRWNHARIEGNQRRMRWLMGRIERWTHAADWLEQNAMETLREAAREACELDAFRRLPERASCELLTKAA